MGGFPAPSRPPTLRLLRAVGSAEPHWSRVEEELLASVARVLEEVRANGVEIRRRGDRLGVEELHELRGQLARFGWERDFLPGESSTRPLHGEHDGWGLLSTAPPRQGARSTGSPGWCWPWTPSTSWPGPWGRTTSCSGRRRRHEAPRSPGPL